MVVLAESYLQKLDCKATMEALNYEIASKTFRRFVDDNHVRFEENLHAANFWEILSEQDPVIKYTTDFKDHKRF